MNPNILARLRRPTTAGAVLTVVLALSLSACAGSTAATDQSAAAPSQGGRGGGPSGPPGVSGKIAAIDGHTLQVQSTDAQTAVTYTSSTVFTEVKAVTADAVKTGLCATVRTGEAAASASTPAASTPTASTPTQAHLDQITASTVTLTSAVNGTCEGGFGGGGARPSGAPGAVPSGVPTDRPSGAPTGGTDGGRGMGTSGKVVSIDGSTFVVANTRGTSRETTNLTVATTADTTWSQVAKTTAKSVAVGQCAFATGKADSSGAVTATALRLSKATNGTCTAGFGGARTGQGAGQGQGGQPSGVPTHG